MMASGSAAALDIGGVTGDIPVDGGRAKSDLVLSFHTQVSN